MSALRSDFSPHKALAVEFKNTQLFPQRGKTRSVSGFALIKRERPLFMNHARSAFKRFSHPTAIAGSNSEG